MADKKRVLILCDASRIFENPLGNIINKIFNLDFTLRIISPIKRLLKDVLNVVLGFSSLYVRKI